MRKATIIILIASASALIIYDIVALLIGGDGATISEVMRDAGYFIPFFSVSFGVLMGHFYFNWSNPWKSKYRYYTLAAVWIIASVILYFLKLPSFVSFLTGLVIGTTLWTLPRAKK